MSIFNHKIYECFGGGCLDRWVAKPLFNPLLDLGYRHLGIPVDDHNGPLFNLEVHCLNASRLRQRLLFLMTTVQAAQSIAGIFISAVASLAAAAPPIKPSPIIVAIKSM